MPRGEDGGRVDGVDEGVELQVEREPGHARDHDLVVGDAELLAPRPTIGVGGVQRGVDGGFEHLDVGVPRLPDVVPELIGAHDQRQRPGNQGRHRHRQHGADERGAERQVGAVEGVEGRRPLVAVDQVDALVLHDAVDLRDPRRARAVVERVGPDPSEPALADVAAQGPVQRVDDRFVAVGRDLGREVDGVDLAAADSQVVGVDEHLHGIISLASGPSDDPTVVGWPAGRR